MGAQGILAMAPLPTPTIREDETNSFFSLYLLVVVLEGLSFILS
jgi:hypothetical protein